MHRCILLLPLLAGCAGQATVVDAREGDVPAGEGLTFPDGALRWDGQRDGTMPVVDGAADSAAPRDGAPADHAPLVDLPPAMPDSAPPASCSSFSAYTCQSIPPIITCSAMCQSGGTTLGIACYQLTASCSCVKGAALVGTCPFSGTGCVACQNALACCAAKF